MIGITTKLVFYSQGGHKFSNDFVICSTDGQMQEHGNNPGGGKTQFLLSFKYN